MSKNHRGRPLRREVPKSGRGTCPVSKRSGVKLLYEYEIGGQKVHISKTARATLENQRKREERKVKKTKLNSAAEKANSTEKAESTADFSKANGNGKEKQGEREAASVVQKAPQKETAP